MSHAFLKEHYKRKLESVGLTLSYEPFHEGESMSIVSAVVGGYVVLAAYKILSGTYIQEQLFSWKTKLLFFFIF